MKEATMFKAELTIEDVLNDPLIRQVMHADGVSSPQLQCLLRDAREKYLTAGQQDGPRPASTGASLVSIERTPWCPPRRSAASQQNII
ncbi:hypothetical protein AGR4C_Cc160236 [Agrobacterium tumefaciens str. Kerr 14]|uniref:Uncharacterized protein n=3 Tax=Rhizobium/Agrobacterium group TaxID=227290 RepID=A0A1S7R8T7_9HYPH|nr:hypothetical protein AGR4C_Cc160236 [Agrobacterium tumefaciens str. Kerr 14]CUX48239.1 hypothetical protein AGR7C_Lc130056 [Agrobacterium deltaense Zutra 3/1]